MGCFGIGGGFIWQGERQPESCSCLGFQTPRAPRFALPISSQETLYRLIWVWLESWFKKKKADSLVDKLFKKESYCAESWSQGVFQVRVDFSFSPPPPPPMNSLPGCSHRGPWGSVCLLAPLTGQTGRSPINPVFTARLSFPAPLLPEMLFVVLHSN